MSPETSGTAAGVEQGEAGEVRVSRSGIQGPDPAEVEVAVAGGVGQAQA